MNDWQAEQQLKYLLESATWAESPNEALFREVLCTPVPMEDILTHHPHPVALVRNEGGSPVAHRQEEFIENSFEVEYAVCISGDNTGQADTIGKDRVVGTSKGKGVDEYGSIILQTIGDMTESQGIAFQNIGSRREGPIWIANKGNVMRRSITFSARLTRDKTYDGSPQINFRFGAVAVPLYTVTWDTFLPNRFDFITGALVRKSGSPPTSETDGTVLTLPADWRTGGSYVDTPPSGDTYYGFFTGYRDDPTASIVYTTNPELLYVDVA